MLPFNLGVGGASGVDTGDIPASLRFRGAQYLSRTPSSAGNSKTWTWSGWVKRGALGSTQIVFQAGTDGNNFLYGCYFNSSNNLVFADGVQGGGSACARTTSAVFRDPTSWLHVVVRFNASATDVKIYVNGVEQAATGTQPSNVDYSISNTVEHRLGRAWGVNTSYFDGYLSRIAFVDGQALTPSSFGYQNTEINEWVSKSQAQVKAVVDAGGTNSFMLDFDDATSLTTLGYDISGSFGLNTSSQGTAGVTYQNAGGTYAAVSTAFNGVYESYYGNCVGCSGTAALGVLISKDWGAGNTKTITGLRVIGSSDGVGFSSGSAVTIKLQGSTDGSAWVDLYTSSALATGTAQLTVKSGITQTAYRHHRVTVIENSALGATHACIVSEVELYEAGQYGMNHWTLNNFSLTAGTTYDHMLDVPGNSFATLNPLHQRGSNTFSAANLDCVIAAVAENTVTEPQAITSGKWYWEVTPTSMTGAAMAVGIVKTTIAAASMSAFVSGGVGYYGFNGNKYVNGSATAYGSTYANNDVIGVAIDYDSSSVTFYKNNVSQGAITIDSGVSWYAAVSTGTGSGTHTFSINFGQAPLHASATYDSASGGCFRYTPPSGYKALCQRNMPDVAILNPEKHFDVVTRTGTAATYSVAGLGFQPDLVWVKSRGRAVDHALYDSVRGVQKQLESNQAGVETTESTGLTAFNSGGYTGGALDQINGTTATNSFVDWLWKAGGAPVTNNAGSISSQVSANVTAGFSIVTYTGTGANATVGHGLGRAPGLVIVKGRNAAWNWVVYNGSIGAGNYLSLNSTIAAAADSTMWNSTAPTSTVFSVGTNGNANGSASTYVAYCFAEIPGFSKIFSYTGNGSADGPYVECGFKPKYILLKNASTTAHWIVLDTVRNTYNIVDNKLAPSSSSYENDPSPVGGAGTNMVDVLSNGFKLRHTDTPTNGNTYTYIGIAFADVPGKYSLAR